MKRQHFYRRVAQKPTVVLLALAASLYATAASAHSWYPQECCNEIDCRRVDRIEPQPDGTIIMHAGPLSVPVPKSFPRRPSQDGDAHICVFVNLSGRLQPRCVFLPLNM